jgi:hypothetical protein
VPARGARRAADYHQEHRRGLVGSGFRRRRSAVKSYLSWWLACIKAPKVSGGEPRASNGDAAVLLATFGLTIFRDLTETIVVGFLLGSVLFIEHGDRDARASSSRTGP